MVRPGVPSAPGLLPVFDTSDWTEKMARQHSFRAKTQTKLPPVHMPPEVVKPLPAFEPEFKDERPKRERRRMDPMTEALGCGEYGYIFEKRWEWFTMELYGVQIPMRVTRFYQQRNLALDIHPDPHQKSLQVLKRKLCEANGIQYFVIESHEDFQKMVMQLGVI